MPNPDRSRHDGSSPAIDPPASGNHRHRPNRHWSAKDGTFPDASIVATCQSGGAHYFTGFVARLNRAPADTGAASGRNLNRPRLAPPRDGRMASALAQHFPIAAGRDQQLHEGFAPHARPTAPNPNISKIESRFGPRPPNKPSAPVQIIRRLREFVAAGESEKRVSNAFPKLIEEAGALGLAGAREKGRASFVSIWHPEHDLGCWTGIQIKHGYGQTGFANALEARCSHRAAR